MHWPGYICQGMVTQHGRDFAFNSLCEKSLNLCYTMRQIFIPKGRMVDVRAAEDRLVFNIQATY